MLELLLSDFTSTARQDKDRRPEQRHCSAFEARDLFVLNKVIVFVFYLAARWTLIVTVQCLVQYSRWVIIFTCVSNKKLQGSTRSRSTQKFFKA